jgi:hypothetical protein
MKFCKREDTFAAILFHEVLLFCHKMVAMSVASWIWILPVCSHVLLHLVFVGLAFQGNDIVFGFIIEFSSLWDFDP